MQRFQRYLAALAASLLIAAGVEPANAAILTFNDSLEASNANWSNSGNWVGGDIANDNSDEAQILSGSPIVDSDFTINRIFANFSLGSASVSGLGTLTINRNIATAQEGILNGNGTPSVLSFDGNIAINNTLGGRSVVSSNNAANVVRFSAGSVLTLNSGLEARNGTGAASASTIEFNGQLAGSANLFFGANNTNVTFGNTADNSAYGGDFVFFANAAPVSNTSNVLLPAGRKIQVNGTNGSIEINGAETFFGNVVVGAAHNFTIDADANQSNVGFVNIGGGVLTLDVDPSVTELAFANSSAQPWGAGTINLLGFQENTIRFGTDATGLLPAQLGVINGGIYGISSQGYLTLVPEPSSWCLLLTAAGLLAVRRHRQYRCATRSAATR